MLKLLFFITIEHISYTFRNKIYGRIELTKMNSFSIKNLSIFMHNLHYNKSILKHSILVIMTKNTLEFQLQYIFEVY